MLEWLKVWHIWKNGYILPIRIKALSSYLREFLNCYSNKEYILELIGLLLALKPDAIAYFT